MPTLLFKNYVMPTSSPEKNVLITVVSLVDGIKHGLLNALDKSFVLLTKGKKFDIPAEDAKVLEDAGHVTVVGEAKTNSKNLKAAPPLGGGEGAVKTDIQLQAEAEAKLKAEKDAAGTQ